MKRLSLIALLAVVSASCVFQNPRNRPLMNLCEKHLVPEGTAAKVATAPLSLPACLAAGVLDTVLIHPATVLDDTWFTTEAMLWQPSGRGYVTECALFLPRAAFTPPFYALNFTSRAVFDVPPWPPAPEELRRELLDPDHEMRMLSIGGLMILSYQGDVVEPATAAMLDACAAHAKDEAFCDAVLRRLPAPLTDAAREHLASVVRTRRDALGGTAVRRLFLDCVRRPRKAYLGVDRKKHTQKSTDFLARLYDEVVKSGAHATEVCMITLAGKGVPQRGPTALALYINRSLARRGWPDYAEAAAFMSQTRLLRLRAAARIDAVDDEWRAMRLKWTWPQAVAMELRLLERPSARRYDKKTLLQQQREIERQLGKASTGQASELLDWTEWLVDIKTVIDAKELAERLLNGPEADRRLFLDSLKDLLKGGM